jgi:serine phosphatase RsbU (regulator of sigma subunit)
MHDEEGHVVAAITTFQDIGARKEAEGRLQRAYDRDHRIAETLQQSLLLSPSIDSLPGVRVRPFYVPALSEAAVGGDFYDAFPLDGGRVALVVGDASGKGVEAAARTAEVKYAVRAFLSEHPHPARALERVNEFLCGVQRRAAEADPEAAITAAFVALALAVIDPSSGEVLFAVAGIEPPLVLRARCDAEPVEGSGLPLGIDPAAEYEVMSRRLTPRDTLLLATDGLTEAREVAPDGARGAFLGYEGFARLAEQACPAPELDAMGRAILDGARAFTGGSLQDDVCLLLARLK